VRDVGLLVRDYIPITLLETGIGLILSLLIGVGVAALLDFSALLRRALYPLLIVSQTIPLFALAPVLILLLGFGIEPKITIVVLFCTFPIVISTLDGLQGSRPEHLALLQSFGARRDQIWRKVRWPAALPGLFSGLRIAATYSVTGAIVGEYISPTAGIGRYMRNAYQTFKTDEAFGAALTVIGLSLLIVGLVALLERVALPWVFARRRGDDTNWNETD
jgi:ABC-type nitrate/sulfonate/bicarbonate transport system permease component